MRRFIAPIAGALALAVLIAPQAAQAKSKYADVRVVTNAGNTLAELRQYTDDVKVKASEEADCFGPSNPSSNKKYNLTSPSVLGALIDASSSDHDLKPLSITDAFVDDGFGFGVCDIGGIETAGFSYWYSSANYVGASTGPDLIPVKNGDVNTWYLTTGDEAGFPNELVVKAPTRVTAGQDFTVKVTRFLSDGSKEPAAGVTVTGGSGGTTGPDGTVDVSVLEGTTSIGATGEGDDIPAAESPVCAAPMASLCPRHFGIEIAGSPGDDEIVSTRGADTIECGKGQDVVRKAQKSDEIANDCEKVKRA